MDDIGKETLRNHRQIFKTKNDGHVWNSLSDREFLESTGSTKGKMYRKI